MKRSQITLLAILPLTSLLLSVELASGQEHRLASENNPEKPRWVDFYRERIAITCNDREVEIEGIYHLRNLTDGAVSMGIQYPFPVDKDHPFPHEIEVEGYSFQKDSSNIFFNVFLQPREEKSIKLYYKQFHHGKSTKYILSSTQQWGHPIQKAEFIVSVPDDWKVNISLAPDSKVLKADRLLYYISRHNFFPKKDLVITWQ